MSRRRQLNLAGFAACAGLMVYALYAQFALGLEPCPLCILQRVAVTALGLLFLAAAVHDPDVIGARIYGVLQFIAASSGAGVAGRHIWLQSLPADQVPSCGPGLDFMIDTFPMTEVLQMVLSGSGECATVDWSFMGLSMPAWVLVATAAMGIFAALVNFRR